MVTLTKFGHSNQTHVLYQVTADYDPLPRVVNNLETLHFRNLELNEQESASGYPMMSQ
jgi:hypothetical protein